jgi:endonuclease/exonuclease/phosphatase (EEP) superfamily protein YafD
MLLSRHSYKAIVTAIALVLLLALLTLTLLSIVTMSLGWHVVLELAAHFQRQYCGLGLALFGLLLLTRRRLPICIGAFCVAVLLSNLLPWYLPPSGVASTSADLRILLSNVWDKNQQFSAVLSLIRQEQPDLVVLMEVKPSKAEALASLSDLLPYSFAIDGRGTTGIAILSQLPLTAPQIVRSGSNPRPVLAFDLAVDGHRFELVATHPPPPVKSQWFHWRNRQLADATDLIRQRRLPVVFVGDLNMTLWSPYHRRLINKTGLKNARQGFGILPSWSPIRSRLPDRLTSLFAIPIDHCLVSPEIRVSNIRLGAPVGSDHRPVIVDLVLPKLSASSETSARGDRLAT